MMIKERWLGRRRSDSQADEPIQSPALSAERAASRAIVYSHQPPDATRLPKPEDVAQAVRDVRKEIAKQVKESEKTLPTWDPDLDRIRVTK